MPPWSLCKRKMLIFQGQPEFAWNYLADLIEVMGYPLHLAYFFSTQKTTTYGWKQCYHVKKINMGMHRLYLLSLHTNRSEVPLWFTTDPLALGGPSSRAFMWCFLEETWLEWVQCVPWSSLAANMMGNIGLFCSIGSC